MKLTLFDTEGNNPVENLKLEENLFRSSILPEPNSDNFLIRFWSNSPCVVMGRFQKRELEVNNEYISKHNLPVLRRFTGGGTVYHDKGTLNFTLIKNREHLFHSSLILEEAAWISGIIKTAILSLITNNEANLIVDQRSNIFNDHKKIMGIALALSKSKFLYHASILIDTDLVALNNSILQKPNYPESNKKFVKSVRSPVMNLKELIPIDSEIILKILKKEVISQLTKILTIEKHIQIIDNLYDLKKCFY